MVKSSYKQLGITCGLPSPVESEFELLDLSSEVRSAGFANDDLSRTPDSVSRIGSRGGVDASSYVPIGEVAAAGASTTRRQRSSSPRVTGSDSARTAVIACYDHTGLAPRIETVPFEDPATYIDVVSLAVMNCVADLGGGLTPEVVFELVSNLAHAEFSDPVISILDSGNTVRVADSGPGIPNKSAAMRPGFSSAPGSLRTVIRGVGAGLPLVQSIVEPVGGFLVIDDNIGGGTVVTASVSESSPNRYSPIAPVVASPSRTVTMGRDANAPHRSEPGSAGELGSGRPAVGVGSASTPTPLITSPSSTVRGVPLSSRQREVLAVVADSLEAGPSTVSSLLDIPLSTAYRDLRFLEDRGLVSTLGGGKRQVTGMGMELLRVY